MSPASNVFPNLWKATLPSTADAAIVGGGFSGLLTAVHLATRVPEARIVIVERAPRRLPGPAYGGCDDEHLLNVAAGRMGAFPDAPGAFHAWLERRSPGRYSIVDFVPRVLFGEYLVELVASHLASGTGEIQFVRDDAVDVERDADGFTLRCASGRACRSRAFVFAPGIPMGRAPWHGLVPSTAHGARTLVDDPWRAGAVDGVPSTAPVVIVGSGLTAIDVVVALRSRGHHGAITMVSRNGRLPLPHALPHQTPATLPADACSGAPLAMLRHLRAAATTEATEGRSWHGVIDAIRPHTSVIWRSWGHRERRAFLRHLRPIWEVHRHRAPRQVLATLDELRASGTLRIVRGRLRTVETMDDDHVRVGIATTRDDGREEFVAARLFNCVGPATSVRDGDDELLRRILASGLATCDDEAIGLRSDDVGRLRSTSGDHDDRAFVLGALRRGELWESTAVPELRTQAAAAADAIATVLRAETPLVTVHRAHRQPASNI
ncbi:MAG: FAD/NAD(P)-binding protein [Phycisphaerales bacterium]